MSPQPGHATQHLQLASAVIHATEGWRRCWQPPVRASWLLPPAGSPGEPLKGWTYQTPDSARRRRTQNGRSTAYSDSNRGRWDPKLRQLKAISIAGQAHSDTRRCWRDHSAATHHPADGPSQSPGSSSPIPAGLRPRGVPRRDCGLRTRAEPPRPDFCFG